MKKENSTKDRELVLSRIIDAPRNLVYQMFIDPQHMPKWWGPNGFKNTIHHMDVREGGSNHYTMHGSDGTNYPNYMRYLELVPNEKIRYQHGTCAEDVDKGFHVTISFEDEGEKTRVTTHMIFASAQDMQMKIDGGAKNGLVEHMNRLEEYVTFYGADSTFTTSRVFDAPIDLVYEVHTKQEHLANFWGPTGCKEEILAFDFRTGGRMFHRMDTPDGHTMYAQHTYREIVVPRLLTMITNFCDADGNIIRQPMIDNWPLKMLTRMSFEKVSGGKTKITIHSVPFEAGAIEHEAFKQGHESMQSGYGSTFDVLDKYLQTLTLTNS